MALNLNCSHMATITSLLNSKELEKVLKSLPCNTTDALARFWVLEDDSVEYIENHPNGGVGAFSIKPYPDHYLVVRLVRLANWLGCGEALVEGWWAVMAPGALPARIVKVGS